MHRYLTTRSLYTQLVGLGALSILLTLVAAIMAGEVPARLAEADAQGNETIRLTGMLLGVSLMTLAFLAAGVKRVLRPLYRLRDGMIGVIEGRLSPRDACAIPSEDLQDLKDSFTRVVEKFQQAREDFESSQEKLAERTSTVDSLLEFSQTIQGAGKADQVFSGLAHYLRTQLGLAGLVIVEHDLDAMVVNVKASWPQDLMNAESPASELDTALCPCLRQNLPRHFKPDGSPVRCAIDRSLALSPAHPAYCIPFSVGRSSRCLAHMLLPPEEHWSEQRRQLAQTYVNTAYSTLISLHLLEEAEKQSMTDALTQLYNRRSMEQLLQREVALSERHGHPLSVVMIDMDKFKEINDAHGHAAGDHMLKQFADCVRITLRKTDLAFRFGGDEFVIALPQTPVAQAQQVVNKLRQAFASVDFSSAIAHLEHQPTLSIGLAERSKDSKTLTLPQLLAAADQALYDAKAANRNCVRVYAPPRAA